MTVSGRTRIEEDQMSEAVLLVSGPVRIGELTRDHGQQLTTELVDDAANALRCCCRRSRIEPHLEHGRPEKLGVRVI